MWSVARPADTRPLGRLITTHPTGSSRVGRIGSRSGTLVGLGWLERPRGPENSLVIDHVAWPPFGHSERAHRRGGPIRGGARVDHAAAGKWGVAFRLEPTALLHNEVASVRPQAKYASGQVLGQDIRVEVGQASHDRFEALTNQLGLLFRFWVVQSEIRRQRWIPGNFRGRHGSTEGDFLIRKSGSGLFPN